MFYKADEAHSGFDNVAFLSKDVISFVEDAGDGLHASETRWTRVVFNVNGRLLRPGQPAGSVAGGGPRPIATLDSANGGFGKNEGDNEITGLHVSDGDTTVRGLLGTDAPNVRDPRWRWFYTQQHGDNPTYQVVVQH